MADNLKDLPVSPMYPAGGVNDTGRTSLGTSDQQGTSPLAAADANNGKANGDNPSITDSTSMFGNGPDVRKTYQKPAKEGAAPDGPEPGADW